MQLCLVRHAIAEDRETWRGNDDARPLTERGRERMKEAAAGLTRLIASPTIYTSPRVRAVQTAEILVQAFGAAEMKVIDALAWGDDPALLGHVARCPTGVAVAVGHEPYISATLSFVLTGDPGAVSCSFKKGAAALLELGGEVVPGSANLEWLIQPGALRALAR